MGFAGLAGSVVPIFSFLFVVASSMPSSLLVLSNFTLVDGSGGKRREGWGRIN